MSNPVLITGCPRSGTCYTAKLLQAHGIDVQHERLGKRGTVDWHLAGIPWNGPIVHQMRNPLHVIGSLLSITSWKWIERSLPGFEMPALVRGMSADAHHQRFERMCEFYVRWNQRSLATAGTFFRVEKLDQAWTALQWAIPELGDFNVDLEPPRDTNTRGPHANVTWDDVMLTKWGEQVMALALLYGYLV